MIGIILIIIVVILLVLMFMESKSKYRKTVDKFPGPKAYPLIGNCLDLSRKEGKIH